MSGVRDSIAILRNSVAPAGELGGADDANTTALWEAIGLLADEIDRPRPTPVLPEAHSPNSTEVGSGA